jgi:hypothetical protein
MSFLALLATSFAIEKEVPFEQLEEDGHGPSFLLFVYYRFIVIITS